MHQDKKTEFQSAYEIGAAQKIVLQSFNGIDHVLIPPGSKLESLEKLMPAPQRIQAHPAFNDIAGFADYIDEFKVDGSRIFVDDKNLKFTTVFDCHAKDQPAWCDHSASMSLELSSEWKRFCAFDGKAMEPKEFAEFLEDNIEYLSKTDSMSGADLLTMAQTFKINVKGEVDVEETLSSGLKHMVIKDDSTLSGRNVEGKEISFPEMIKFDLRIFKNHSTYPISVYLRTRTSNRTVMFMIKIPDTEGLQEAAFDKVIEDVKEKTELPTLKGEFDGPNHRRHR